MASDADSPEPLQIGDAMPRLAQRTPNQPKFSLDSAAGRYIVLCFFGTLSDAGGQKALQAIDAHRAFFDDANMCLFGVSVDRDDEKLNRIRERAPGIHIFWDFDCSISKACGIVASEASGDGKLKTFLRSWMIFDPTLHVLAAFPFENELDDHRAVFDFLKALPPAGKYAGFEIPAPVLVLPHVFTPDLCKTLIGLYEADGGKETGVMRGDKDVLDPSFKRRRDYTLEDPGIVRTINAAIARCVIPQIEKLFFMKITRMERYIVGCYAVEDGGHFAPHRDNRENITAHRRFAVSINLNADFEGGGVRFPEYNMRTVKAPPGWAVVFPCAILHEVAKVTAGRRYAFLPFVYDETGSKIREFHLSNSAGAQT
jgi:peroxiredoxin/predicted 2-oxoglutarate/Fe(II)-dependent dioxygenase YbiX